MHAYNNFIDINKERIYNYDITLIFDDTENCINDLFNKIEIITSITKLFNKTIKYIPHSKDIIEIINKFKIRDLNTYSNYIQNNSDKYINIKKNIIADNCLISVCFDQLDKDWIIRNNYIFEKIYIISYKKYKVNLNNVHIIYSKNNPKNYLLDIIFFSNDIKIYFNKIFYFTNCQKLGILNGQTIDINTDILKNYISRLDILKHNYKYNKTLIQLYNKTYEIDEDNYFFCRNRYINFTASNNINCITNKHIQSPLVLISNYFSNKTYANECSKIISLYYPDNIFEIKKPFLIEKYIAEYNNTNTLFEKTNNDIIDFLEYNYNVSEFIYNSKKKIVVKNDTISPYDYQFFDNSIIVEFKYEIQNDILILCYIYNICKEQKKKLFIKWSYDMDINNILQNTFYLVSDCNDSLKKYNPRIYNNYNDTLLILSNDIISIVSCDKIVVDSSYYNSIINTFNLLNWSPSVQKFLSYLSTTINININKCICVDINIEKIYLLKRLIKYNQKNIILFNKLKNFKYTQIPLKKSNMVHQVIKLILLSKSYGYLVDKNITNIYKIIMNNKFFHFDQLLKSNNYLTINKTNTKIVIEEGGFINKQIYFKAGIINGTLFILTNDSFNKSILEKLVDNAYINEICIITSRFDNTYKNYKVKYINSKYTTNITINNIINNCKYDKILISSFVVDTMFFLYNFLDDSNFYINKSRDLCFFSLKQFYQLNGFSEYTREFIYDFSKRLTQLKYTKNYIMKRFDISTKTHIILEKNIKSWGKECKKQIYKLIKKNNLYVLK